MRKSPVARLIAFLLLALVVPACHDDSDGDDDKAPPPPPGTGSTLKAARLSGLQEVPPVATGASGDATVEIDPSFAAIVVTVNFSGLADLTGAHIHVGDVGLDGPIIFPLASGPFTSPLIVSLTAAQLTPQPGSGVMTFSDAIAALRQGRAYVNLHSTASPDGEIRGQVGPVSLVAQLNGLQEAPPVATAATGTMSLTLSDDQASISFSLNVTGLANITAAHIHAAPPGIDGPIIFPLATGPYSTPLTGTLTAAQFTPPITGFATFAEAVDGMIAGLTYANVHTTTYPDGEIRGQIRGEQAPVPPTKPGR